MAKIKHPQTGEICILSDSPSMTNLDCMRQALTNAIAQRMHKHIKPHPEAIDIDDVIVEREGWLTVEELMAASYINAREIGADTYDCFVEAAKRNVV